MANIKQQKKRVGTAQRQRLQNLRYKSTAKTLLRSLQDAVNASDKDAANGVHRELVRTLDRAAARNALHSNTVSRKKSRAARILVSEPVKETKVVRRTRKKAMLRKPKAQKATAVATAATTVAEDTAPLADVTAETAANESTGNDSAATTDDDSAESTGGDSTN